MPKNNNRFYYIYLTTNLINGKNYVGKHHSRLNDKYLGSGDLIKKAITKHGPKNFSREIIAVCSSNKILNILETSYIDLYKSIGKAEYNLALGGDGGNLSKESREKQAKSLRNFYKTLEGEKLKQHLREINLGKEPSPEVRNRICEWNKTYWNTPEGMETRKLISKQQKGRIHSKEQIEKARKSNTGKKRTTEQNKKNSKIVEELWKNPTYRKNVIDSHKRLKWWTNGIKDIQAEECPPGFRHGRSSKAMSKCCPKGRKYFNNGIEEVMRFECPPGYVPGRCPKAKESISKGQKKKS